MRFGPKRLRHGPKLRRIQQLLFRFTFSKAPEPTIQTVQPNANRKQIHLLNWHMPHPKTRIRNETAEPKSNKQAVRNLEALSDQQQLAHVPYTRLLQEQHVQQHLLPHVQRLLD